MQTEYARLNGFLAVWRDQAARDRRDGFSDQAARRAQREILGLMRALRLGAPA